MKWIATISAVLFVSGAPAHGPLDNSVSLALGAERIEAAVVIGTDVAEEFFKSTGFTRPQPAGRGAEVSTAVLARLFELLAEGQPLIPSSARVATDGLEYRFSAQYAAAPRARLQFHARYFALNEQMPAGALVVRAEDGTTVFAELLSRTNPVASITLPTPAATPVVASSTETVMRTSVADVNPPSAEALRSAERTRVPTEASSLAGRGWLIAGLAALLGAGLVAARRLR